MKDNDPAAAGTQPGAAAPASEAQAAETYALVTRGIRVSVRPFFLEDQSQPDERQFVWAYRVRIENQGTDTVRLLRRTWHITDSRGRTQHVEGSGVVGEQPQLHAGEAFEYTSGTPLETPSGFMSGAYHMVLTGTGEEFDVQIPTFSLDSPHQPAVLH
ncbi:Co2+/Mg2+ efflux protein ApaG [Lichenicoccus roseus]|uniref:Protein ApaG n=1 Tax=Lichenicoccus roseus TaxID=2683649 RepID=A0A5R9JA81_9PROT|nr:Co2+/Mg2+ efflux protein ApaG [Lichenicoccus roseus]TLU74485.1 Co2+/Mg2+ efflux protein ApaG [Lichenicoccus roseus]